MPDPNLDLVELRAHLADRDVPCPSCNYSLRALTTDRCPECNQQLVLAVRLAEPRLALWITGLIGLAVGLGFHGLILLWAAVMQFTRAGGGGPNLRELIPLLIGFAFCAPLLATWTVRRRAICRWPDANRTLAVIGLWLGALLPVGWFFASVR